MEVAQKVVADNEAKKARLQSEKDQVDAWPKDSDTRLARDAERITALQKRTSTLTRIAGDRSEALLDAVYGDHPMNQTSDCEIVGTTHTQPGALSCVLGLRRSLIQSRVQMNGAMAGS